LGKSQNNIDRINKDHKRNSDFMYPNFSLKQDLNS